MKRHRRYAPQRLSAVATYSPRCVAGLFSGNPRMVLNPERPLVPPRFSAFRLNMSQAERASAWVMIEKYTPRIRLRNVRYPNSQATAAGTTRIATTVKSAL